MTYEPKIDDYVKWNKEVEGWVYFKCKEYVTIEASVRPKDCENYEACSLHRNERLLVLCYTNQWKELEYVKSRKLINKDESNLSSFIPKTEKERLLETSSNISQN